MKIVMNRVFYILLMWLMGFGVVSAQEVEVKSQTIDVGQVKFANPVSVDYELKNKTKRPLLITEAQLGCGCMSVDYPHQSIPNDEGFVVKVTYDAQQMGHFEKHTLLYIYGIDEPIELILKGVVVEEIVDFTGDYPYKLGDLLADARSIEFDDVNRGDRPVVKIHIKNPTSETAYPLVMHLPNYLTADVSPSRISSGQGGELTFTLNSTLLPNDGLAQTNVFLGKSPGDKVSPDKEIAISAVLLPGFGQLTDVQLKNAPVFHLSTTKLDLGSFNGKKKLKGEIEIINKGKSRLDITAIQMFTIGIQVEIDKLKIMPGEVVKMKISAVAKEIKSTQSKPRILMITNDPKRSKVIIDINVK